MKELKAQGVHVKEAAVDITNKEKLAQVIQECAKKMPPLKGVIHSAMVLDDALISKLTDQSIEDVMKPKISGCLNLHECTLDQPLDFFVLFSSISSLIGNPGQGNYAAANAFLDSFCHYRKKLNLPVLTINWGALKLGALARDTKTAKYLEHHGIKGLNSENALKLLEKAILSQENHLCALDVNWQKLLQSMPAVKQSGVFSDFSEQQEAFSNVFLEKAQDLDFVMTVLKEMIGKTLKMDPKELDEGTRLNLLGVDSLMAMELHTMIEINLGITIPSMELMKGPSIKHLAHLIRESASKCSGAAH
jgi:acyl carrier protein/short-subunit dehydrogenase